MHIQLENVVGEMVACFFEKEFRKPTKMSNMLADLAYQS
jgi:hypothetical protein